MTANAATPRRPSRQSVLARWAAIRGSIGRNETDLVGLGERTLGTAKARRPRAAEGKENLEAAWTRTRGKVKKRLVGVAGGISSLERGLTVRSKTGAIRRTRRERSGEERGRRGIKSRDDSIPITNRLKAW
jgi:hypothetical protein